MFAAIHNSYDNETMRHIHNRMLFICKEKKEIVKFAGKWRGQTYLVR